jgi:hypothetical protein
VPAGTHVHIDIFNLHRNPEFWPNPEVFDPDRFLSKDVAKGHPFAYIPFSAGSRNCIGNLIEMLIFRCKIDCNTFTYYRSAIRHDGNENDDSHSRAQFLSRTDSSFERYSFLSGLYTSRKASIACKIRSNLSFELQILSMGEVNMLNDNR